MNFLNIAFYQFTRLDEPIPLNIGEEAPQTPRLAQLRLEFQDFFVSMELSGEVFRGTVLLSPEGINGFVASRPESIKEFQKFLKNYPEFSTIEFKESLSEKLPFTRILVKIKKEIISMGLEDILPELKTGSRVEPEELSRWLDSGKDDSGREVVLIDTRNDYETELGKFENAIDSGLKHFRKFPEVLKTLETQDPTLKEKTVVMYCTGGIRCEKATALALKNGFKNVYQLNGGILKYFEKMGGKHYQGDCFVFDHRVALDPELRPIEAGLCYDCRAVILPGEAHECLALKKGELKSLEF